MLELSLPGFDYKVKKQNGTVMIFDIVRKKYVVLTPEEWVRQHVVHYLVEKKGYAIFCSSLSNTSFECLPSKEKLNCMA